MIAEKSRSSQESKEEESIQQVKGGEPGDKEVPHQALGVVALEGRQSRGRNSYHCRAVAIRAPSEILFLFFLVLPIPPVVRRCQIGDPTATKLVHPILMPQSHRSRPLYAAEFVVHL